MVMQPNDVVIFVSIDLNPMQLKVCNHLNDIEMLTGNLEQG